jgi:hypothetical protein
MANQVKKRSVGRPVEFYSDGVRLAGDVWALPDLPPDARVPGVLLVHGWGGVKQHLNAAYAPQFAALGTVSLAFDYRGWGESDGKLVRVGTKGEPGPDQSFQTRVREVREIVDPLDQLEDIRAALAFLMGEPQVDPKRLAIWGSSLGGGLALQTAAQFPEIQVLITQIGAVNPQAGLGTLDSGDARSPERLWSERIAAVRKPGPPEPPRGGVPGLAGVPDWDRHRRYDPMAFVDALQAATLIIDAEREELFDRRQQGAVLFERIKDRLPARYEILPGSHYELYEGDGYRAALALEREWLRRHLELD